MSYNGPEYDRARYKKRSAEGKCVRRGCRMPKDWPRKTCPTCLAEVRENARDNYWLERGKEIPPTVLRRGPVPMHVPQLAGPDPLDACRCEGECDCDATARTGAGRTYPGGG